MKYLVNRETKEHRVATDIISSPNQIPGWMLVEADAEGWIKWDHSEKFIPLSDDEKCQIHSIHGVISSIGTASDFYWGHVEAYRPILDKPEPDETMLERREAESMERLIQKYPDEIISRLKSAHEASQSIPDLEKQLREVLDSMGYDLVARSPFVETSKGGSCANISFYKDGKLQATLSGDADFSRGVYPPQLNMVLRGMVEYAECNDPGNPYLAKAKAILENN